MLKTFHSTFPCDPILRHTQQPVSWDFFILVVVCACVVHEHEYEPLCRNAGARAACWVSFSSTLCLVFRQGLLLDQTHGFSYNGWFLTLSLNSGSYSHTQCFMRVLGPQVLMLAQRVLLPCGAVSPALALPLHAFVFHAKSAKQTLICFIEQWKKWMI